MATNYSLFNKTQQWLVAAAIVLTALFALLSPAAALAQDGPTPEPTKAPLVADPTDDYEVTVEVETIRDAEWFVQQDGEVYPNPVPGYQGDGEKILAQTGLCLIRWTADLKWALVMDRDCAVEYGWIDADNIEKKPVSTETTTTGCQIPAGKAYVTANSLIKRAGPGTGYASQGSLPYGATVQVTGCDSSGYWAREAGGFYLGSKYLSTTKPSAAAPATRPSAGSSGSSSETMTGSLDYQDDPAGGCAASSAPMDYPACILQRVQSGELSVTEGIVAIQQLTARFGVPSQDGWTTLQANEHAVTFGWCSGGFARPLPNDTARPLEDTRLESRWWDSVVIVQPHPAADPATNVTMTCPSGDGWAMLLH